MISSELAQYIDTRTTLTLGTDLFIGEFPKTNSAGKTQRGVYLVELGGDGQDAYLDVFYNDFDIWSVDPLTPQSYGQLRSILDVMGRNQNFDLTGYHIFFSHDISGIMDMDRTIDGLKMYKATIRLIYSDRNLIS